MNPFMLKNRYYNQVPGGGAGSGEKGTTLRCPGSSGGWGMGVGAGGGEKGTTLPEVLIALMILLFATTAVSGMFLYSADMEKQDQAYTEAGSLAVYRIEEIKKSISSAENPVNRYEALTDTNYDVFYNPDDGDTQDDNSYLARYVYDVDVDSVSGNPSIKYVGVTVYYRNMSAQNPQPDPNKNNGNRLVRMGTYILKPF